MPPHPFETYPTRTLARIFWPLLALILLMMAVFYVAGLPLNTSAAPNGIVSFEVAGTVEKAAQILASWDGEARVRAGFIQGFDYLFLLVYSTAVAAACVWAARILSERGLPLAALGRPLAWAQWMAALFDALENLALVVLLFGPTASPWPWLAAVFAYLKFALLFAGIIYAFYGLTMRLAYRSPSPSPRPSP